MKMTWLLASCMLCLLVSRLTKGQSSCVRTNRSPVTKCTKKCEPSVGCDASEEKCLCDGDCGYSCVRKDLSCGSPPPVSKATPNYPSTNFGAVVTYVCNQGYTLSGASTRTCRAIGGWDGVGPSCLQVCTVPDIPFSMYISIPENYERTYKTGETITLACKKGFKEKPGGNSVRICISGRWAQFPFECEGTHACKRTVRAPLTKCTEECAPESGCRSSNDLCLCDGTCGYSCVEKDMSCGNPPAITNGKLTFNGTKYNSTAHYTCNKGYSLNTIFPVKRCTAKKRWSGITPTCMKDCSAPAIPRNANISNPSDTYNSGYKVTFKCNEGYNEEGIATQMCFQGKWTVLPFKCSVGGCGDPGTPKNGRKVGVTYSVNSKVYFGCEFGYELMGSEDRKCQPNGSWTGQQPVCTIVDCGLPPQPVNGWSIGNQTKFRSVIKFKCNKGYNLVGSETRICTSDKKWGGREAKCEAVDCGQISAPVNGSITGDKSTYPSYVDIYCDQGFILRGSHRRKCQANGQWNGTDASCAAVDCGRLSPPMNGSLLSNETTYPNEVEISCDEGFILRGSFRRKCQADKTWSGESVFCEAKDCSALNTPSNGSLVGNLTTYPHKVQFMCDEGFKLQGSKIRQCLSTGNWSGTDTLCDPVNCGGLSSPMNGSIFGNLTVYPNIVTFSCDSGFILRGSSVRKCQSNGTWDGYETTCEVKDCGALKAPVNGSLVGNLTTYPHKVQSMCDEGFNLRGSKIRQCLSTGNWSGQESFCEVVDCGPITVPVYAIYHGNSTKYLSVITFSCKEGFFLYGEASRMCQADGKWSSVNMSCRGQDCGKLAPPEHGWIFGAKTTHPNSVFFNCGAGYTLVGSSKRTCLINGSWSGQQPQCLAHWCNGMPEIPAFAYQTLGDGRLRYEDGERIYYSCKPGYIMVGTPERQCVSGQWSPVTFNCTEPSCNAPKAPKLSYVTHGRGSQSKYLNGEKVYYSCQSGYKLVGIPLVECRNGVWRVPKFRCQAVSCGGLSTPLNGFIRRSTGTTYNALFVFGCNKDQGYLLRGSAERRCLANATWSGNQPTCYLQRCATPDEPSFGKVAFRSENNYSFGDTVQYKCNYQFSLRGHKTTRCQIYGNWSNPVPECIRCSSSLGLKNRMIFSSQLSASSSRDSRHSPRYGRLYGNRAWCSARSSLPKYFQIDFGRTTEVTAVATQGHPKEYKWMNEYVLQYSLGKQWLTYQESGRDKVFQGNRNRNSVVKHFIKEQLVTKQLRILRYQISQDSRGSSVCLRAEVYGCYFDSSCLTVGSEVLAHWNSLKNPTRYFHGFIAKIRKTSVDVSPSGKHNARVDDIVELPRAEKHYVIKDETSKENDIKTGAEVIVTSQDGIGFSRGKVDRIFGRSVKWYEVQLGDGKNVWRKASEMRLLISPVYCDRG